MTADVPPGGRIVEACRHGNPMDMPCKLCGRVVDVDASQRFQQDPAAEEKTELLAIAFGLLLGVDAKKQGADWAGSFAEWKDRYAAIDPRGRLGGAAEGSGEADSPGQ